jgi:cell shape-determining protein MreC
VSQLKELLKKEIAIKFVLLERCKNLKGENDKLRDIIGKSNPFEAKTPKKDVGCQISIGSS